MISDELLNNLDLLIEKFVIAFKNNEMDSVDKYIYNLLNDIIILEASTISKSSIYSQLKESYFDSEKVVRMFLFNLLNRNQDTIRDYIDICLEQIDNEIVNDNEKYNRTNKLKKFIMMYYPNLDDYFNEQLIKYDIKGYK